MRSAHHQTLNWHVYNDIVRLISSGHYPPGTRLDEQQIAEELGVSRTPLREAISKLVKDGLVEHRPYKGNFVRRFTSQEVFDLYEVRKGLESMAVRLAIPHLTADSISELRSILREIGTALEASDLEAYGFADKRFHDAIAHLSGNQTLISLLAHLSGQIQLIRTMANQDPSIVEITAMERPEIVDAMEEGDVAAAMHLMEEHIELVQNSTASRIGTDRDRADAQEPGSVKSQAANLSKGRAR
jgi:DNA-binding GntR family transcriptional regulator